MTTRVRYSVRVFLGWMSPSDVKNDLYGKFLSFKLHTMVNG